MNPVDISMTDLPDSARELVRVIGVAAALSLIRAYGGCTLDVPRKPAGTWYKALIDLIGTDAADALMQYAPGVRLDIPNCKRAVARGLQRAIAAADAENLTAGQIAKKFGVTKRYVRKIRAMPAAQLRQPVPSEQIQLKLF